MIITSALHTTLSETGALSPSIATGIAILSAVATLLGGILTGALLLWRFSSLITAMRTASESGYKETAKAIDTLSEKTAAAIEHLTEQTRQSIEAIEKNLGSQIAELKSDKRDQEENVRRLEVNVSRLEGGLQRAWVEIDALRLQTGSLQRIAAQREK